MSHETVRIQIVVKGGVLYIKEYRILMEAMDLGGIIDKTSWISRSDRYPSLWLFFHLGLESRVSKIDSRQEQAKKFLQELKLRELELSEP